MPSSLRTYIFSNQYFQVRKNRFFFLPTFYERNELYNDSNIILNKIKSGLYAANKETNIFKFFLKNTFNIIHETLTLIEPKSSGLPTVKRATMFGTLAELVQTE